MRIPESSKEFPIPQVITKLRTDTLKWVRRTISLYPVSLSPKPAQLSTGRGHLSLPPLLGGGGRRRMEYVCNFPALWRAAWGWDCLDSFGALTESALFWCHWEQREWRVELAVSSLLVAVGRRCTTWGISLRREGEGKQYSSFSECCLNIGKVIGELWI